jgi:hypothetical protein
MDDDGDCFQDVLVLPFFGKMNDLGMNCSQNIEEVAILLFGDVLYLAAKLPEFVNQSLVDWVGI